MFQVYIDRRDGLGPVLDGCWESENCAFESEDEACETARWLHSEYPDSMWIVIDTEDGDQIYRISSREIDNETYEDQA